MGHVDHGKTSLLDAIRQSGVAKREHGGITQHVGASEVPLDVVQKICGPLLQKFNTELTIPGLLFIDTPGHEAFTNLRKRGGGVADIAVLVIDVTKGIEAQTIEAIEILREYKTPFIIALNKSDALSGWISKPGASVSDSLAQQRQDVVNDLDERIYRLIGKLYDFGFQAERFDRVSDMTKQIIVIPCSAKTREGLPELLMFVSGLAQKFLKQRLELHSSIAGKGSILEVREEIGLGKTLDVILYDGTISQGDAIVFATDEGPKVSKVKALLKPKPLDEMRDPREKFSAVKEVVAASGVKISCEYADQALAGSDLVVIGEGESEEQAIEEIKRELLELMVEKEEEGVIVRADTLGSLEAIAKLFAAEKIPLKSASIGNVFRKHVMQASAVKDNDKLLGVIFAFNVEIDDSAKTEAASTGVKIFDEKIIYNLIEGYKQWSDEEKAKDKREAFARVSFPAKIFLMPGHCFRVSGPAVFGVEIIEGRIRKNQGFMDDKGESIGTIRAIQHEKEEIEEAKKGQQVAISMPEPFYGRQIKEKQTLYSDCSKDDIKILEVKYASSLSEEEKALLKEIKKIKGYSRF
ncbi:TPA: translation initiation factor IF-2 [Candidatus Micrarchaeota archaeon]|nr:translation initiation factor IF-2 [Candidatus Micrarchaeota archaeon]